LEGLPRGPGPPWNDDVGAYPSCERAPAHSFDEIAAAGGAVGQLVSPSSAEISDHRYFRSPPSRPGRARRPASEQRDGFAPPHGAFPPAETSGPRLSHSRRRLLCTTTNFGGPCRVGVSRVAPGRSRRFLACPLCLQ